MTNSTSKKELKLLYGAVLVVCMARVSLNSTTAFVLFVGTVYFLWHIIEYLSLIFAYTLIRTMDGSQCVYVKVHLVG